MFESNSVLAGHFRHVAQWTDVEIGPQCTALTPGFHIAITQGHHKGKCHRKSAVLQNVWCVAKDRKQPRPSKNSP